jgi:hypothetical protein
MARETATGAGQIFAARYLIVGGRRAGVGE